MTDHLFPPPAVTTVPVVGLAQLYPVNRIFCVGRNYEAHAKEMGHEVDREAPFYFTKSRDTILLSGNSCPYPPGTENYHYEMEFVIALGAGGFQVAVESALDLVYGYACGLDMTRRDLQTQAKAKGRPWDLGKDVEGSAIINAVTPAARCGHPDTGRITLSVDGEVKQDADLADLIWKVPEIIADLSKFYHLRAGDLIYTGTPAGVGPVTPGQTLHGSIDGLGEITLMIEA